MNSLPSNELLDPIFEKEDLIEDFKVIWFIINKVFGGFEISGGSYTLPQMLQGRLSTRLCVHSISRFY